MKIENQSCQQSHRNQEHSSQLFNIAWKCRVCAGRTVGGWTFHYLYYNVALCYKQYSDEDFTVFADVVEEKYLGRK